jgi:hypothetical protein
MKLFHAWNFISFYSGLGSPFTLCTSKMSKHAHSHSLLCCMNICILYVQRINANRQNETQIIVRVQTSSRTSPVLIQYCTVAVKILYIAKWLLCPFRMKTLFPLISPLFWGVRQRMLIAKSEDLNYISVKALNLALRLTFIIPRKKQEA